MNKDIIIYTRPEVLLHKMGMLYNPDEESDMAFGKDCEFYWTLPNRIPEMKRIYFATKGYVIGYFKLSRYEDCDVSWYADTWTLLKEPVKTTHFQGFMYARNVPELIKQVEAKANA